MAAPEPHIRESPVLDLENRKQYIVDPVPDTVLFRREIDYQVKYPQGKPADLAALNRAKAEAAARGNGRA